VRVFDITKQTESCFNIIIHEENKNFSGYLNEVYMKEKVIIIENKE
jgi:predicted RNA-binding protein